jgi:predicted metalloprotease with PDZ domain
LVIKAVLAGSGGAQAGLIPQDEVLAIDDERLSHDTLENLMNSLKPGKKTRILVSRRGRIMSLELTLDAAIADGYSIVLHSRFGKRHVNRLQSLLGQNLKGPP